MMTVFMQALYTWIMKLNICKQYVSRQYPCNPSHFMVGCVVHQHKLGFPGTVVFITHKITLLFQTNEIILYQLLKQIITTAFVVFVIILASSATHAERVLITKHNSRGTHIHISPC
jgi:hypothetical protein